MGESDHEKRPLRSRLALFCAVAVLAVAMVAVVRMGAGDADPRPTPSVSPRQWPAARGACGEDRELPLTSAVRWQATTGLRVLVGGQGLFAANLDSGVVDRLVDWRGDERTVVELRRDGEGLYFTGADCNVGFRSYAYVDGRVRRADSEAAPGVDPSLRLPKRVTPVGVAGRFIVGTIPPEGVDGLGTIVLVRTETGRFVTKVAKGRPMAVGDDFVLWSDNDCRYIPGPAPGQSPDTRCPVHRTRFDGGHGVTYRLPKGRVPVSDMVLSGDGRYAAFQLARAKADPRYAGDHPVAPSDVAVLDLATKRITIVPGFQLAPKSDVGLTFSRDARWLVLAANYGDHGELFAWRQGGRYLYRSAAEIPGPLGSAVVVTAG